MMDFHTSASYFHKKMFHYFKDYLMTKLTSGRLFLLEGVFNSEHGIFHFEQSVFYSKHEVWTYASQASIDKLQSVILANYNSILIV
jgi:hypothetical protein